MSTWADNRRANRAADAEQRRADAAAKLDRTLTAAAAQATQRRADQDAADQRADKIRADRKAARAKRFATAAGWLSEHRVRLPIYLLAVVSAVMAVPAMSDYGVGVYRTLTGGLLPALSELGMWAFAVAVEVSRHCHPQRPVWTLQLGVWLFAGTGAALNVLHGIGRGWNVAVVMGIVSVAGVIAHQIAVAAPRRSRAERDAAKIERHATRKIARVRTAAVRHAVAEIDRDGAARLVFAPGRYTLTRHHGRTHLVAAIETSDYVGDVLADEVTAWLAVQDRPADRVEDDPIADAAVQTLDRPSDQGKSTPTGSTHRAPKQRTFEQAQADFTAALADPKVAINPKSAESIRKTIRCKAEWARKLRDEYQANHQ
ncbi:hypothetical protein VSH64_37000 [Amycolatopsis rhabdoformis]|uniref:DUF2637 domain-containing protein n=1 Tax=Amycolatopsis rhabdoformis TaxID=1448059 RepID=A0ABZ1I1Y7_9PSEU|nr:hypothetical protein [Amycolatopsis rhabdoformis]WSE28394.1 hypothetical protein VSH64_37000 [Amycolatopsis rhabdoformis]